ncbi:alpha/beta hydrolase [Micromonospora sp. WMMD882]|uniref:alpha/beta fold hydrolase n=1 Tax=Micromonospora sp. WMMD882 TaxID=3015151 RepID=UPI00248AEC91|nr:alpha/beta hydrolase [Micromonospora sp. WMMD882]WBB79220.1 alpha/beta hydrolase [Micromonospora sp. WMMD882]
MTSLLGRVPRPRGAVGKAAGLLGAAVGVAAAGLAAGVATERALVRRYKADPTDRYADEVFGQQRYDEAFRMTLPDGTDVYVEVVEPTRPPVDGVPPADRPTVVLVHGFCLDMGTFHFQRKLLAQRGGHRVVAYDQPGHGRSGKLASGDYDIAALGHTLRRVLDRTAPEGPLVLVGHSMGGMTIMAFAELYPEMFGDRVIGAALMATSGGLLAETKLVAPALLGKVGPPVLYMVNTTTRYGGPVIDRVRHSTSNVSWLLTRRFGFGTPNPSPALVSYVEEMNSRTSADTVTRYLRTLATHSRYPALAALAGTPVLVVAGEKDMITPVTHSEEIVRRLPHAEFVRIPDGGHVVMLEHADEVDAALTSFLERL